MKVQIKSWLNASVLFECEVADDEPFKVRAAVQIAAGRRADLAHADLAHANLAGANLAGPDLAGADLARAYLAGADLAGADLAGADLARANLAHANLAHANLAGAKLIDGGLRSDGWRFFLTDFDGEGRRIKAGICRNFTPEEARKHWQETRGGTPLGDETVAILDHMDRIAELRGWDKEPARREPCLSQETD